MFGSAQQVVLRHPRILGLQMAFPRHHVPRSNKVQFPQNKEVETG